MIAVLLKNFFQIIWIQITETKFKSLGKGIPENEKIFFNIEL